MKKLIATLILLIAIALPSSVYAQSAYTGSLNGSVADVSGQAVDGVKVTATSPALQGQRITVTNHEGVYRFPSLPVGIYKVTYERPGFGTLIQEKVEVRAGFTVDIKAVLQVATSQVDITVTAETQLVDLQNSYVQNSFGKQVLEELPNVRDMGAIQSLSPGIRITTPDVGGSQSGSIAGNTSYGYGGQARTQIDGVNTTEGTSSVGMYFDYGNFQEVSIVTAANDASMPVPGQFINIVLKGGGNEFHGGFYQDFEHSALQSSNISDEQHRQGAGLGSGVKRYFDTNFDIGGPIVRDRLWFYTSIRNQDNGRLVAGYPVDNPQGETLFNTKVEDVSYKFTGQINSNHRLSHFLQWDRKYMPLRDAGPNAYESAVYATNLPAWAGNIQYDGTFSPRFMVTARIGSWGYNSMNAREFKDGELPFRRMTEQTTGNNYGTRNSFRFDRRRLQFDPTFTWFVDDFLRVDHQFKFGWLSEFESRLVENAAYPFEPENGSLSLTFNSVAPAGQPPLPDFTTPFRVTINNSTQVFKDYQRHHGFFIQDQVRVNGRLSLSLGVRWDYYRVWENDQEIRDSYYAPFFYKGEPLPNGYSIPATYADYNVPGQEVIRFPFLVAPRLGFSLDLTGKGKTVLKGNWGLFYSNPAPDFGNNVNRIQQLSYTFAWDDKNGDKEFQQDEFGAFLSNSGDANVRVSPNLKTPYVSDTSIFLEHQLDEDTSVRAGFVYRTSEDNWQRVDVARTADLFTQNVTAYDPGPDGIRDTADDRGDFQVWDIPAGTPVPASRYEYQTLDGNKSIYRNWEITATRRVSRNWAAQAAFFYTLKSTLLNGVATTPNMAFNNDARTTEWTAKFSGTYYAPYGVNISGILRGQSGTPLSRVVSVTGLRSGTFNAPVDSVGTWQSDNIWIADLRLQKQFSLRDRARLDASFDLFNLFNSNANLSQDNVTGIRTSVIDGSTYPRFLSMSSMLPPRVARFAVRFAF